MATRRLLAEGTDTIMRMLRSYPIGYREQFDRKGRMWVEDHATERFMNNDYDYTRLGDYDDDILLIEWDKAASKEHLDQMAKTAAADPHTIKVAPYLLYERRPVPVWAHRRVDEDGTERWINSYELECELFGFGLIYLPRDLIRAFLAAPKETRGTPIGVEPERYTDYRFIDQTFSMWHYRTFKRSVDVLWAVRPVHLHW
jgi:hypothetical protein